MAASGPLMFLTVVPADAESMMAVASNDKQSSTLFTRMQTKDAGRAEEIHLVSGITPLTSDRTNRNSLFFQERSVSDSFRTEPQHKTKTQQRTRCWRRISMLHHRETLLNMHSTGPFFLSEAIRGIISLEFVKTESRPAVY